MAIVSSETIAENHTQADGSRDIKHLFTDNAAKVHIRTARVPGFYTETEYAILRAAISAELDLNLKIQEVNQAIQEAQTGVNPDRVPVYQTQAEFDRRLLGRSMVIKDIDTLYAIYPFFVAVRTRGGANAGQRAAYLGITTADWNLIDNRFNDLNGIAFFITDDKAQRWTELPEVYL